MNCLAGGCRELRLVYSAGGFWNKDPGWLAYMACRRTNVEFHYTLEMESGWRCFIFCVRWAFYFFPFAVYMSECRAHMMSSNTRV